MKCAITCSCQPLDKTVFVANHRQMIVQTSSGNDSFFLRCPSSIFRHLGRSHPPVLHQFEPRRVVSRCVVSCRVLSCPIASCRVKKNKPNSTQIRSIIVSKSSTHPPSPPYCINLNPPRPRRLLHGEGGDAKWVQGLAAWGRLWGAKWPEGGQLGGSGGRGAQGSRVPSSIKGRFSSDGSAGHDFFHLCGDVDFHNDFCCIFPSFRLRDYSFFLSKNTIFVKNLLPETGWKSSDVWSG